MKKKIVSIAAAIVAFVAINASAQNTTSTSCTPQAKCQTTGNCKKSKSECTSPFAGLNLNDTQKQAIKDLKKPSCKGDTETGKDRKTARSEYLAKIKTILTPEQYQQFLENNFVKGASKHNKHGMKNNSHNNKKGDCKGKKQNCKASKSGDNKK